MRIDAEGTSQTVERFRCGAVGDFPLPAARCTARAGGRLWRWILTRVNWVRRAALLSEAVWQFISLTIHLIEFCHLLDQDK